MDFDACIYILPGQDCLLNISQISDERVGNVSDKLSEGDKVKVLEVGRQRGNRQIHCFPSTTILPPARFAFSSSCAFMSSSNLKRSGPPGSLITQAFICIASEPVDRSRCSLKTCAWE